MKTMIHPCNVLTILWLVFNITGCQDSRFQSEYFEFAKESDAVEFKAEIKQVPDHVDEDMVYFCRTGIYDERQVVYKGVTGTGLIVSAYQTTRARIIWNKEIPAHRYIAEIIVPQPDQDLLYSEFQKAVNQQFEISPIKEVQNMEVLELNKIEGKSISFEETDASVVRWSQEDGEISGVGINMNMLSSIIERVSNHKPIFNAIEDDQRFAIELVWEQGNIEDLNSKLLEYGLELQTKRRDVEVVVVNSSEN